VVAPLPPLTLVQPVDPSADCCHCIFAPELPVKFNVFVLPVQIDDCAADAVPTDDEVPTVICAVCTFVQLPLETVQLIVVVPTDNAVTFPDASTVATDGLLLAQTAAVGSGY
jgi:hypothetical protein